ncbi:MAG: SDR family oxidoreductase [Verrucomicrobiota bacterium]
MILGLNVSMSEGYVLITGASSGLGEAFARAYVKQGRSVIITARRESRLQALAKELKNNRVEVQVLAMDLNDVAAPGAIFELCQNKGWVIEGLVNNAGLGWQIDLADLTDDQLHRMLHVNMVSLSRLMHLFLPSMVKRRSGFILNIASTAAFQPIPHFSVYGATKAYVVALTEAVHEEVRRYGVTVTCLCPGPVDTEFQQAAGMDKRFFAMTQEIEPVVAKGLSLVERNRALGWSSISQRISSLATEVMPHWLRRKLAGSIIEECLRRQEKRRRADGV